MPSFAVVSLAVLSGLGAFLYAPVRQRYITLGIATPSNKIVNIHGSEPLKIIPNTIQCEDLHHEKTTNVLFAACQATREERSAWFPPLVVLTNPKAVGQGTIVRVDPTTFKSTTLNLNGFSKPMVTHGIDILNDPTDPSLLWIYIVNHLPDPNRWFVDPPTSKKPERAHIEVFKHRLGTDEADFVRSIRHPLIAMPNDLLAMTPTSFYVTNDHVYHTGAIRVWEDVASQGFAPASTVVHVDFSAKPSTDDPAAGVDATVALHKIHNSNGLGIGSALTPEEVLVVDAAGGVLHRTRRDSSGSSKKLHQLESIQLDSTLDNPSYYFDAYATAANNASGYILPGLSNAASLGNDFPHLDRPLPSCVWHVRSNTGKINFQGKNEWEKRLVFEDDGKTLRSASGAVMVGIDPKANDGRKQAWLFVTGFGSEAMIAAKVDL